MRLVYVNPWFDVTCASPAEAMSMRNGPSQWCGAVNGAGHADIVVLQRFAEDASLQGDGIMWRFVRDGSAGTLPWWRIPFRMLRMARRLEADVIHVNGRPLVLPLLRFIAGPHPALIWQHHGGPDPTGVRRILHRMSLRAADAVFCTAPAAADRWKADGVLPHDVSVYGIIEASTRLVQRNREDCRAALGVSGDPLVLWAGRLDANKDPLTILNGFAMLHAVRPSARLVMLFQDSPLADVVWQRMAVLGIEDAVRMPGAVPHEQMASWFSAADLFTLGSHQEAAGFALIEAVACGLTTVVTAIPPFEVITSGGKTGPLFPVGDDAACGRAMIDAASSLRPREWIREYFDEHLSWKCIGRQAAEAYASIDRQRQNRRALLMCGRRKGP